MHNFNKKYSFKQLFQEGGDIEMDEEFRSVINRLRKSATAKASSWNQIDSVEPEPGDEEVLNLLPILDLTDIKPIKDIPPNILGGRIFFIAEVKYKNANVSEFFLVDTQGYTYARYAVRLIGYYPG